MLRTFRATLCLLLGKLLGRLRQYQSSLRYLKLADSILPNSLTVKCWIGWAYQQLDNQSEALSAFEQALQVSPSCAYAHAQMGRCLANLGQHQQAVDELLRATRIEPKYEVRREYLLAMGSSYSHLGLMNESVRMYGKAHNLFPDDGEVVYRYGWALCAMHIVGWELLTRNWRSSKRPELPSKRRFGFHQMTPTHTRRLVWSTANSMSGRPLLKPERNSGNSFPTTKLASG
jgi:tetratricopeptide (TPR) repeat protein